MNEMTFSYNGQETKVTADGPAITQALDEWTAHETGWDGLVAQLRAAISPRYDQ